jgi:Asp/Glu/hydantoin racemase
MVHKWPVQSLATERYGDCGSRTAHSHYQGHLREDGVRALVFSCTGLSTTHIQISDHWDLIQISTLAFSYSFCCSLLQVGACELMHDAAKKRVPGVPKHKYVILLVGIKLW